MLYRKMKKADPELSILGFGAMRLPVLPDGHVDEPESIRMIRYAVDHGVNYIDTAYPYHNGESETAVGKALADGYRDRVHLATKLPSWLIKTREDMDRYLDEQLGKLQTDHIDFYLVHGLIRPFWENLSSLGVLEFLDDALADGRISYAGFSFHDSTELFREIVDAYDWTFAQIQYNFMDEEYQAGTKGLRYAAVEVPSGVRGRMSLYGPMIEQAEAAIIIHDADFSFGCMGCARANELIQFLLRKRDIPLLDLRYPRTDEEGIEFVAAIRKFLQDLPGGGT